MGDVVQAGATHESYDVSLGMARHCWGAASASWRTRSVRTAAANDRAPRSKSHMRVSILILLSLTAGCHLGTPAAPSTPDCRQAAGSCPQAPSTACGWGCCGHCKGRHAVYWRFCDKHITRHEARRLARADLDRLYPDQCPGCDFQLGFEQSYVDVAMGANGDVPSLPPAKYWANWARTAEGHQQAQQWFSGYAVGVSQARARYEPFNEVATSHPAPFHWAPGPPEPGWPYATDPVLRSEPRF